MSDREEGVVVDGYVVPLTGRAVYIEGCGITTRQELRAM
jgi:hypothetical protein